MNSKIFFIGACVLALVLFPLFLIIACGALTSQQTCDPVSGELTTTDAVGGGTPVYFIGDSIGVGLEPYLQGFLGGKGTLMNQSTGSITLLDSIPKLEGDKEKIKRAKSVVIELGTNTSTDFANEAKQMVNKIKAINPNAKIYWVEIFSELYQSDYNKYNEIIRNIPGVEVIETKGKVNSFLPGEVPLGTHPDEAGNKVLARLIKNEVMGSSGSSGGDSDAAADDSDVSAAAGDSGNIGDVPGKFIPFYQGAAEKFGLGPEGPSMLAGIHFHETSFSTNIATTGPYVGPMAIGSDYWDTYGVDGDDDGKKDIFNEADAIYAAAKILKGYNAKNNWRDALASYNAGPGNIGAGYGYADDVMAFAKKNHIPATGGGSAESDSSEDCPAPGSGSDTGVPPTCDNLTGTPKDIIDQTVLPLAHTIAFEDITPQSVDAANAAHSTQTSSGNLSEHKGPPEVAWAADISNSPSQAVDDSATTPEMDQLAEKLAKCFGIKWSGSGVAEAYKDGYRAQMLYRTEVGGNHYNHVHIGISKR